MPSGLLVSRFQNQTKPPPELRRFIAILSGVFLFRGYAVDVKDEFLPAKPVYGPLPALGLPVQVQCDGFKYMAFRNKDGRWVDFFTHEILTRVLGVVPA
jgi:hypothetical protein